MNLEKKKILVVAAHPDDDILGCGGTLAKAISLKAKVKILFKFPITTTNNFKTINLF